MDEEYKGNSHKEKEETALTRDKVEKPALIVHGKVEVAKKTGISSLADNLFAGDLNSVKNYVINEVIIPGVKQVVMDTLHDTVDIIFKGEVSSTKRNKKSGQNREYYSYQSCYKVEDTRRAQPARTRYSFGDLYFETRGDAEMVLDSLQEKLDECDGVVSVLDLYDMIGKDTTPNDNKYGWSNLDSARVVRTRDGEYILKLPRALPID